MEMVKNPPHGYGKKMNPCIDCKIFFLRRAGEIMSVEKASFVATGEVVGQRPMSQMKHMLNHIEKESGLKGYLLRPLSAKLMKPTLAEQRGIVDRERLMGISGRGRGIQTQLAEMYSITEYATPAGGCLFTDTFIAKRVRDLFEHHPDSNAVDGYLLTVGRHFRISKSTKIIVGRNESENLELEKYRDLADYFICPEFKGPSVFVKGALSDEDLLLICSIVVRYGRPGKGGLRINVCSGNERTSLTDIREPVEDRMLESMRI
jgi:hypothetical protein